MLTYIWGALLNLVPFVQFKKQNKKHRGVLSLPKLQTEDFHFFKIAQMVLNQEKRLKYVNINLGKHGEIYII